MDTLVKLAIVLVIAVLLLGTVLLVSQLWSPFADLADTGQAAIDAEYSHAGAHVLGSPRDVLGRLTGLLPTGAAAAISGLALGGVAVLLAFFLGRWLIGLVVQS